MIETFFLIKEDDICGKDQCIIVINYIISIVKNIVQYYGLVFFFRKDGNNNDIYYADSLSGIIYFSVVTELDPDDIVKIVIFLG